MYLSRFTLGLACITTLTACGVYAPGIGPGAEAQASTRAADGHRAAYALQDLTRDVASADIWDLVDHSRQRQVPLRAYFPKAARGPLPVVLFSHGYCPSKLLNSRSRTAYAHIGMHLASQGYVALHVQHDDHADSPLEYNRPLDIRLVVNRIAINRLMIPSFKGTLDAGRIGHAGHSAGAYTAMALAGAKVKMPPGYEGTEARFAEPRIKAFVAISPQGVGSIGVADSPARASFEPGAWSGITRPMYEIVGEQELGSDAFSQNRPPAWRLDPWRAMPAGDKHLAILPGADHMNFRQGGLEPGNAVETRTLDFTHANMAVFFDVYLKNERAKWSTIGKLRRPAGTVTEAK